MGTRNAALRSAAISIAAVAYLLSQRTAAGGPLEPPECQLIGADHPFLLAQATGADEKSEAAARSPTRGASRESTQSATELLLPPQEQELKQLSGVLKALAQPDTSAGTLVALDRGQPFSLNRFAMLMGDVRAIEIHLQAQELRSRLDKADGTTTETRNWIEPKLAIMESCALARFAERGGSKAYQDAVTLVQKLRHELQPFLFQTASAPKSGLVTPPKTIGPKQ